MPILRFLAALLALASVLPARAAESGLERLYVLHCGENHGRDQARWSPGVNEGIAIAMPVPGTPEER